MELAMTGRRNRSRLALVLTSAFATVFGSTTMLRAQVLGDPRMADSLQKLRLSSTFAFHAQIDSLHASTVKAIAASAHTIAVTPSSSLQCPHAVGVYAGEPVTVYVDDTTGLAPKQEWWFFASGWVIGSHLAVRSLARFPANYGDSVLRREFLGPNGPRAQLLHHLEDTVFVVTGRLALDSVRPFVATAIQKIVQRRVSDVSLPLIIGNVMLTQGGLPLDSTVNVAVPLSYLLSLPLLQVSDAYQHLLFLLHVTLNEPGDLVFNGPKPSFMVRSPDDIRPIADSAGVASVIAQLPKGRLGAPPTDFVAECGALPP
jgi:hypothetical protein